jgi:predicted nucleic acid-binding protein
VTDYILDSYAWIEYLQGSRKGAVVEHLLSIKKNHFFTLLPCLGELSYWALQEGFAYQKISAIFLANSTFLQVSEDEWVLAGQEKMRQRKTQKDFGLIDACILVKQAQRQCKVVSGDKHFRSMKNVIFLE